MQEAHDEGRERADSAASGGAGGVDEGTNIVVELRGGGWRGAIGYGREFTFKTPLRVIGLPILWEAFEVPEFFFHQPAALLIAQGKLLQDFFPPDVYFAMKDVPHAISRGPYFLLKGEYSKPMDPPPRLKNMVLAHVLEAPSDMKMEDLRARLLEYVL
jgi:hypothetical protein